MSLAGTIVHAGLLHEKWQVQDLLLWWQTFLSLNSENSEKTLYVLFGKELNYHISMHHSIYLYLHHLNSEVHARITVRYPDIVPERTGPHNPGINTWIYSLCFSKLTFAKYRRIKYTKWQRFYHWTIFLVFKVDKDHVRPMTTQPQGTQSLWCQGTLLIPVKVFIWSQWKTKLHIFF